MDRKAIKSVSMLLPKMPAKPDYKVIFMMRPVVESVASQARMIQRLETDSARLSEADLRRGLSSHRDDTLQWLSSAGHMEVLQVDYRTLIKYPVELLPQNAEFLGVELLPRPEKMLTVIDPKLYRQQLPMHDER